MKNIRLRARADGLYVSAPFGTARATLLGALEARSEWIGNALARARADAAERPPRAVSDGARVTILGETYPVRLARTAASRVEFEDGVLYICGPDLEDEAALRRRFDAWRRRAAQAYFEAQADRLYPLVAARGAKKPDISVRAMKTRWGSCSPDKGRVTFNTYLYEAPPACVEYVVLHELAHLLFRFHDAQFYGFVARIMPDYKRRQKRLEQAVRL